jgi:hypothetical protein
LIGSPTDASSSAARASRAATARSTRRCATCSSSGCAGSPARDRSGRPLTVGIIYTAVWSRD